MVWDEERTDARFRWPGTPRNPAQTIIIPNDQARQASSGTFRHANAYASAHPLTPFPEDQPTLAAEEALKAQNRFPQRIGIDEDMGPGEVFWQEMNAQHQPPQR